MYFSKFNHSHGTKEHNRDWRDANSFKPEPFALQNLLLDNGKIKRGWWTGTIWDGISIKHNDIITKFKKCGE